MVWFVLNLPFGATSGFVSVMLGFILKKQGMGDDVIASLVALNLLPHTWKVFWAPIADSTLTRKRWYILGNVTLVRTILGLAFVPITKGNLGLIEWLVFLNSLAITFVGMSVEGLMAHATPPEERGRAAGMVPGRQRRRRRLWWRLGLFIAENVSTQVAFIVIAVALVRVSRSRCVSCPKPPALVVDTTGARRTSVARLGCTARACSRTLDRGLPRALADGLLAAAASSR